MKRLVKTLLVLAVIGGAGYWVLFLHSPTPGKAPYELDMAEVRRLATSMPGGKPLEIRVEQVAGFYFAEAMVMAGEPWKKTPIPVYSYQIVLPDETLIVDAAVSSMADFPDFVVSGFDQQAYERMSRAMEQASQIHITHEHFDHIAGIADHPNLPAIMPALRLTQEQIDHPDRMAPTVLPEAAFADYQPFAYEGITAIAPGVVLIEAPGHTPGSQMVFVQLASGREVLLLGDVSWQMRNIHAVRERPMAMTLMIKEDRGQVIEQFQALHDLREQAPELVIVPGHDQTVVEALLERGVLQPRFRYPQADAVDDVAAARNVSSP